jgi:hypothetical protein
VQVSNGCGLVQRRYQSASTGPCDFFQRTASPGGALTWIVDVPALEHQLAQAVAFSTALRTV